MKIDLNNFFSKNFFTRTLTALLLSPTILYAIYLGELYFYELIIGTTFLMFYEWINIIKTSENKALWLLIGAFYILIPNVSFLFLRESYNGFYIVLFLLLIIWATDIGAYIFGSLFKGPRLAPSISPNKRWIGLFGGLLFAVFIAIIFDKYKLIQLPNLMLIGLIISILGQIGDLIESAFKRHFKVKDSGKLIPGHGGILDRADSLIFSAPFLWAIIIYFQNYSI